MDDEIESFDCSGERPGDLDVDEGLRVLGFYHHKSSMPLSTAKVREWGRDLGFKFPVAVDRDWTTLNDWWLKYPGRQWTSVSFLIDRKGIIRYVHPGGQYVIGDAAYKELHEKIQELLKERIEGSGRLSR